jgi:hypothetical protein
MYTKTSIMLSVVLMATASYSQEKIQTQILESSVTIDNEMIARSPHIGTFNTQRDSAILTKVGNWPFGKVIGIAVDTAREIYVVFDGQNLASGIYHYRLQNRTMFSTGRCVLMK